MVVETRGLWNLDKAIAERWLLSGLDSTFRNRWQDPNDTTFQTLHDERAAPKAPFPYCIYSRTLPTVVANMSGLSETETRQIQELQVQFEVYGKSTAQKSGKTIASELAAKIGEVFDQGGEPLNLCGGDALIRFDRGIDYSIRPDEDVWAWVIIYEVQFGTAYLAPSV